MNLHRPADKDLQHKDSHHTSNGSSTALLLSILFVKEDNGKGQYAAGAKNFN